MKYYKDADGAVYAYETNTPESLIPCGLVKLTPEEEQAHLRPIKSIPVLAGEAIVKVNAEYTRRMGAIADDYPLHERESWPVQLQEARELQTNPDAVTPWLDACALQRGMPKVELAQRVLAKDAGYRWVSGFFTGVRQCHEDCITMLLGDGEEARAALESYDHLQGWEITPERHQEIIATMTVERE